MKDNPFRKVKDAVAASTDKAKRGLKARLEALTPKQRLRLVAVIFAVFVIVDIIYIIDGFRDGGSRGIEVEHIQQVELENQNNYQNDTIPEPGHDPGN